jgi:pyruvate,water dikinase
MRRQAQAPREALQFFDRVHATVRWMREERPESATDARLAEILGEMERYNEDFVTFLMAGLNRASSKMLGVELLFPPGGGLDPFINAVASAGGKNVSVRQGVDLLRLARLARSEGRVVQYLLEGKREYRDYEEDLEGTRFLAAFREYLAEYGHRGVQETDPAMPVYLQDPTFLLKAIRVAAADPLTPDPGAMRRRQEGIAALAWKDLRRSLPWIERLVPVRLLLLRRAIRDLREAMALRERIRFEGMRVNAEFRRFLAEAGSRLCARGLLEEPADLFLLRIEEIEGVLAEKENGAPLREAVRLRREERRRQEEIPMPNFLRESEIPGIRERAPIRFREEGTFHGLPVGPGRVEGKVVILEGPHQVDRVHRGDILVAPTLDPSWIPLLPLAAGLVVEMGGTLSHGSIIAREYGLPTVVNLPGITRILRNGERVLVDGGAGLVRRLEE